MVPYKILENETIWVTEEKKIQRPVEKILRFGENGRMQGEFEKKDSNNAEQIEKERSQ